MLSIDHSYWFWNVCSCRVINFIIGPMDSNTFIGAVIVGIQMSKLRANNWGITGLSPPTSIISSFKRSVYEGVTLKPCTIYFFALLIGTKKYAQLCWPSRPNNHYSRRHSEYKLARVKSFYFLQVGRECRAHKGVWHLTF